MKLLNVIFAKLCLKLSSSEYGEGVWDSVTKVRKTLKHDKGHGAGSKSKNLHDVIRKWSL